MRIVTIHVVASRGAGGREHQGGKDGERRGFGGGEEEGNLMG